MSTTIFNHPHFIAHTSEDGDECSMCHRRFARTWAIRGMSGRYCDKHFDELVGGDSISEYLERKHQQDMRPWHIGGTD